MNTKSQIRIVKRGQRNEAVESAADGKARRREKASDGAREMVATVSAWVRDFQNQRRVAGQRTFASLFKDPLPS
ncbi:MAG: hypothetical protein ACRD68_14735 [Pyrinomonadaceae bacterium]